MYNRCMARRRGRRSIKSIPAGVKRIRTLLLLFVAAVIGLSYLGVSQTKIGLVAAVFIWLIVGAIFSLLATSLIELLTGNSLKRKYLWVKKVRIGWVKFRFSLSVFAVASAVVAFLFRYWLIE
ncbi:MAG: hypothetical protein FJZ95_09885 [Chloroflexi bacterium]|nr:hypothetical protein [Chloroflexota bacterium]